MIQRVAIGAVLVMLTAANSFAQTFTQTFNAGIPPSWTIVDNHALVAGPPDSSAAPWTTNDIEGLANFTRGTPTLAATASSFNHPGQYDISLITPTFVLNSGVDGTAIIYDINFYRVDAFEAFDTNLSINGGPWITMVHETSSEGAHYSSAAPRVSVGVSLPFYGAAVGDSARVEFRYYSTFLLPMVHNQYVQIDNVQTPTPVPEPTTLALAVCALAATRGFWRTGWGSR